MSEKDSDFFNAMFSINKDTRTDYHFTLEDIIKVLESCPDQSKEVK